MSEAWQDDQPHISPLAGRDCGPLVRAALAHLSDLVGPDALDDHRVQTLLAAPWDRTRKRLTLEKRLRLLGLGVVDRQGRGRGATWQVVARLVEIITEWRPTERQIEHARRQLVEFERQIGRDVDALPEHRRELVELDRAAKRVQRLSDQIRERNTAMRGRGQRPQFTLLDAKDLRARAHMADVELRLAKRGLVAAPSDASASAADLRALADQTEAEVRVAKSGRPPSVREVQSVRRRYATGEELERARRGDRV